MIFIGALDSENVINGRPRSGRASRRMAAKDFILLGALIGAKTASRVGVRPAPHA
jgi:hypothetical protein